MNLKYVENEDGRSESILMNPGNFGNLSTIDNAMRAMRLREYGVSAASEAEIKARLRLVLDSQNVADCK